MAISNLVPQLWDSRLLLNFRKDFVFSGLTNRNYEGEISGPGSIVKVQTPVTSSIPVVARSGNVSYSTPTTTTQNIVADEDHEWAFEVEDLESIQANVDLLSTFTAEGSINMADAVDADIASLYTEGTAGDVALTLASGDIYEALTAARKNLRTANVPIDNSLWCVISPDGEEAILNHAKTTHATTSGDNLIRNGSIGRLAGFNIYISNNLTLATTRKYMYGHPLAITWGGQLMKMESLRDKDTWNDYMRSRMVWARKVVRPTALGTISATE